ncbi:MAG: OmpA family protein [Holosporales bacterium]|nr:OmpA family protein [Holosporales bacterium]
MDRKILVGLVSSAALVLTACSSTCGVDSGIIPGSPEDFAANVPTKVYFDFDKAKLSDAAKKRVSAQACWLKTYTNTTATVTGHTDVRGTGEYNMALGSARASATVAELVANGVQKERLTTVSYGKERVEDPGTTEEAHAKNRRTETIIGTN